MPLEKSYRGTPRTGPRGTTLDQVARVASQGSSAIPPPPPIPQVGAPSDILQYVIGAPATTAGQKYGGYSTQSQLNAAVLGGLEPIYQVADLALAQAEAAAQDVAQRYKPAMSVAEATYNRPATEMAGLEARRAVSPLVGREFAPSTSTLGKTFSGLGRNLGEIIDIGYQKKLGQLKQDELNARLALEDLQKRQRGEIERLAGPYAQIVDYIQGTPASALAQQLAVQRYGIDPAMAAGLYGPEIDIARQREAQNLADLQLQEQMRAAGLMPGASTLERIFQTEGPEAALAYEQSQATGALDEIADTQLNTDLYNTLGVTMNDIGSGAPTALVREWVTTPGNIDLINEAVASVQTLPPEVDRNDYISNVAANYYTQTGDPVGAQFLANTLRALSFFGAPTLDATTTWQPD